MREPKHEEQKRERRRAEREEVVAHFTRLAERNVMPASHHTEQLAECEARARFILEWADGHTVTWADRDDLLWYRQRIQGHAIRAIVAMLRELLEVT